MDMEFMKNFNPTLRVESPGRINLIGEHTDYNLGFVLPTAIEKKIFFKFQKNGSEHTCNIYSLTYDTGFTLDLNTISRSQTEWENYILGVLNEIQKRSGKLRGFDCTIESNLSTGSGLSSSAALECGLAYGLNELFELGLSKMDMVKLSQTAEHTYVGTLCGIMDQFASVMSKEGHVILLDCKSLEHQYIPFSVDPYRIVLLNTKVSHNLASSEYNTRKQECQKGVAIIREKHPQVRSLRDVTLEMLASFKSQMDGKIYNRCLFIVQENDRVLAMTEALNSNNLEEAGRLLYEAHDGISTLYEVSCPESDFLVEFSKAFDSVAGARQTGGGFGGCTLNLVREDAVHEFVTAAADAYKKTFNIDLEAFEVKPSGGTFSMSLS
ncbi:MAG: galactokinase [Bacteroidota bacterium]